jgi:hypothetical protein
MKMLKYLENSSFKLSVDPHKKLIAENFEKYLDPPDIIYSHISEKAKSNFNELPKWKREGILD